MDTVQEKRRVSLADAPDDLLISKFVQLKDARAARKKAFELEDANDKMRQEKLEIELLRRLNERGTDSTSSRSVGTAYRLVKSSCSVADKEVFRNWVIDRGSWEFLDIKANKTSVDEFRKENGDLPPGLNWSEVLTIGIRRS